MSITISDEEYEYLQRCRATAEFLGEHTLSRTVSIENDRPFDSYPTLMFEFRGAAPIIPHEKAPYNPTASEGAKALDMDYLNHPPASRKLLPGG